MASVSGATSAATFSLTNAVGSNEAIAVTSGTLQTTLVNGAYAAPLVATVTNNGTAVSGVSVTFTAPATGASGTFANSTATDTETTDVNGVATSTVFTANAAAGAYAVTAAVSGVSSTASFSLTNYIAYFSFFASGTELINNGPNYYAIAGSIGLDALGNVLGGEQDYNDAFGLTSPQPSGDSITGGTLTVDPTSGQGTLNLVTNNSALGLNGTETLAVQFVNSKHALIAQFDGSATSSGSMDAQTLPSTLSGNYAFTLSGVDSSNYASVVSGGVFSISGTTLQNGILDLDDAGVVTLNTSFTGTVSAADAYGRGTITNTLLATTVNYYVVGPEVIRIIDVDTTDAAVGSAFGQGSGTFSNASLGTSVFGVAGNAFGALYAAAGQFTVPTSGTFTGYGDEDEEGDALSAGIAGNYSIGGNGYGSLSMTSGLNDVGAFGIYMTDPALNLNDPNNTTSGVGGALIADLDLNLNGTGVLTPQTDTATASFDGNYAFGAQDFFCNICEIDYIGQGSVTSGALTGAGQLTDEFGFFASGAEYSGATFTGTPQADTFNVGRYTMSPVNDTPNPFVITVGASGTQAYTVALYQANGGQLMWVNTDYFSLALGSMQQQGSLTGMPALKNHVKKSKTKIK
jgi:hypothetical protein